MIIIRMNCCVKKIMFLLKTLHLLFPFKQSLLAFSLIIKCPLPLPSIPPTFFSCTTAPNICIYASLSSSQTHQAKPCSFTTSLFLGGSRASWFFFSSHSKSQLINNTLHFLLITTSTLTPCHRSHTSCTNTTFHVTPLAFTSHRRERFPMHQTLSTTVESSCLVCLCCLRLQNEHIKIQV